MTSIFIYVLVFTNAADFFLSTVTALVNLERGPLRNPVTEDLSQPWQEREEGVLTLSEAQQKVSTCEQFLFAAQTFSGNISCVSSIVVAAVFWSSLVSTRRLRACFRWNHDESRPKKMHARYAQELHGGLTVF